jgi:hypothetical protein
MARATSTGEHVVLVLTRIEADATERLLSYGCAADLLRDRGLRIAARRSLRALVDGRRRLRE